MMTDGRFLTSWLAGVALLVAAGAPAHAQSTAIWEAASGLTPDQICPAWTLVDTAPGADPVLANGTLTLATAAPTEDMYYVQTDLDVPLPDPIVVEGRVRFTSGSSNFNNRGPVAFALTTAANTGTLFFVGNDEIFLTAVGDVRGQSATVDTHAAAHTYHIEVTAAGAVTVSYDGTPTLTGTTYTSAPAFGPDPRILWGEGSIVAFGMESWESFRHNAATCASGTTTTGVPTTTTTSTVPGPGGSSTSTTLPPGTCEDAVPGSLDATRCRLQVLAGSIAADSGLGKYQAKLSTTLARATALAGEGSDACNSNDSKTASRRMKQVQKLLQKMSHRLRGLAARKHLDAALRAEFITMIDSIRTDVGALRSKPCDGA